MGPTAAYFQALAERLRRVRVCCGDWARVCGPTPTEKQGLTGVFLDPPYGAKRTISLYAEDSTRICVDVRDWAVANGGNPALRIAMCGYDGDFDMPNDWAIVEWKAHGGYGSEAANGRGRDNAARERIWFSPHCLGVNQQVLDFA